jgi:hypothetical protein
MPLRPSCSRALRGVPLSGCRGGRSIGAIATGVSGVVLATTSSPSTNGPKRKLLMKPSSR